jgi:hypothetical protein
MLGLALVFVLEHVDELYVNGVLAMRYFFF